MDEIKHAEGKKQSALPPWPPVYGLLEQEPKSVETNVGVSGELQGQTLWWTRSADAVSCR